MSARDQVLGRVRNALAGAPAAPPVPRDYRAGPEADPDLAGLFVDRVTDDGAKVVRCRHHEVPQRIASELSGSRAVVPVDLPWRVAGAVADTGLSLRVLDEADAVVTAAAVGIARTGTIVLDHGSGQGRRALSLVPDVHICVVRLDQLVHGVPEAVARLDPRRPQTWISGPSATSDIELDRVEGVHGPRDLRVILTS